MIPIADLGKQNGRLRHELEPVFTEALLTGGFVLGRPVEEFEEAFAAYCGARFGVGVNSGTSALHLALLAAGVGPGDEVITTTFTFVATAAAIAYTGARPVLVDIEPGTFTIDPSRIEAAITPRSRALLPVHLYGHCADMDPILEIGRRHGLAVIEDAAQAHGAEYKGRRAGSLADAACFSFYPAKNLGACGEGGIVLTDRPEWAEAVRRLRDWGQKAQYHHVSPGFNYRMEGIQGGVLGVKLRYLEEWNAARRRNADRYTRCVSGDGLVAPRAADWAHHVYHIYAVRACKREAARDEFLKRGIETRVHYPVPIHLMNPWRDLGYRAGDFPHAEQAASEVLSIPVHPELEADQVDAIAEALQAISSGVPSRDAPAPVTARSL